MKDKLFLFLFFIYYGCSLQIDKFDEFLGQNPNFIDDQDKILECTNGATNFPDCNLCISGQDLDKVNNICVDKCQNGANNPPNCNQCQDPLTWRDEKCVALGTYYVDPTYDGSNGTPNGSFLRPWTQANQIRTHRRAGLFSTGDNLFFKSGTVMPMNVQLYITWHGTAQNRVVIGTYFGETDFGNGDVPPSKRAVLDGQNFSIPAPSPGQISAKDTGLIVSVNHPGYVTIQDLEIRDSGGLAIIAGNSGGGPYPHINQYYIIRNNYFNRSWGASMTITRSSHNQILNNVSDWSSYGHLRTHPLTGGSEVVGGSALEVSGMNIPEISRYNVISGNTVMRARYEGIASNKQASHTTITNNIVYDCGVNIYVDIGSYITISNNLVYGTPSAVRGQTASGFNNVRGIFIEHEWTSYRQWPGDIKNVRIFNNYIAGGVTGINVGVEDKPELPPVPRGWENVEIFNNIIVGNARSFRFQGMTHLWQNNYIYDNYSFNYTLDTTHTTDISPHSFTWNRGPDGSPAPNYFIGGVSPGGNAVNHFPGAILDGVDLIKQTGWRNLVPGGVSRNDFAFVGAPVCGSLTLQHCIDEIACDNADGHWYNNQCNAQPRPPKAYVGAQNKPDNEVL